MKCSACARELPDGAAFCPACATPVDFSSTPTVTRVDSPAARAIRAGLDDRSDDEAGAAPSSPHTSRDRAALLRMPLIPDSSIATFPAPLSPIAIASFRRSARAAWAKCIAPKI